MRKFQAPDILVTADAGELGSMMVEKLLESVGPCRLAGLSNGDRLGAARLHPLGVEVRHVDYDSPESLDAAFLGIERFLLISSCVLLRRSIHNRNAVEAARRAGVKFGAFTSGLQSRQAPFRVVDDHLEAEAMLRDSGIAHATVRNGWCEEAASLAELSEEIARRKRGPLVSEKAENEARRLIVTGWPSAIVAGKLAGFSDAGSPGGAPTPAFV